jgi:transposase
LKIIQEKCSEALHILDRFHIVAKMNKALDEIRAEETRRMKSEGRDSVLKNSRWLLLKRSENLLEETRNNSPSVRPWPIVDETRRYRRSEFSDGPNSGTMGKPAPTHI